MPGTIRKLHAFRDHNFASTTDTSVNTKFLVNLAIIRHANPSSSVRLHTQGQSAYSAFSRNWNPGVANGRRRVPVVYHQRESDFHVTPFKGRLTVWKGVCLQRRYVQGIQRIR